MVQHDIQSGSAVELLFGAALGAGATGDGTAIQCKGFFRGEVVVTSRDVGAAGMAVTIQESVLEAGPFVDISGAIIAVSAANPTKMRAGAIHCRRYGPWIRAHVVNSTDAGSVDVTIVLHGCEDTKAYLSDPAEATTERKYAFSV